MNILIAFGTTEGQTRKIVRHIADTIGKAGHSAEIYDCSDRDESKSADAFDAVIVAASVHQKRYQNEVYDFIGANLGALGTKPSAFISVSLAITLSDGEEEARKYVDDFADETGWQVDHVHLAEGAIRYLEYDFFKIQTIEHVVLKGRKTMSKTDGNPEYTDWNALDAFALSFLEDASKELAPVAAT